MSILDTIKAFKIEDVARLKKVKPQSELTKSKYFSRDTQSISAAVKNGSGVISEFKRASPSKGIIHKDADIAEITSAYEGAGASAISVLTDQEFFKARKTDLEVARKTVNIPILRKEFIVDDYQLFESRAMGADAILLIAAMLTAEQIRDFNSLAHDLGLEVLIEVHNEMELSKLCGQEDMVGINNRNLNNFEVDLNTSFELVKQLKNYVVKVSESGISGVEDIKMLKTAGFDGFLIGEHFMRAQQPDLALGRFIDQINSDG